MNFKDRVRETSASTGTGNFTLAGAVANFQTFNTAYGIGAPFSYAIIDNVNGTWETGIGQLSDATTLVRTTVQSGSNGTSPVNFAAGSKDILSAPNAVFLSNVPTTNEVNNFALANETPTTALATGATLTPDASKAYQTFTTSANFTIAAPTNRPTGRLRVYVVRIIYAGAHSATSIDSAYKYNGTAPAFSNASGKFDDLIISDDGTRITYELKAGYTS